MGEHKGLENPIASLQVVSLVHKSPPAPSPPAVHWVYALCPCYLESVFSSISRRLVFHDKESESESVPQGQLNVISHWSVVIMHSMNHSCFVSSWQPLMYHGKCKEAAVHAVIGEGQQGLFLGWELGFSTNEIGKEPEEEFLISVTAPGGRLSWRAEICRNHSEHLFLISRFAV